MTRSILIADGPAIPDDATLDAFWSAAREACPDLAESHQVRSIGIDAETTDMIIDFVKAGTKRATFSLPWVLEANGFPDSLPGTPIILSDYEGTPQIVVKLTDVREITVGEITAAETGLDGPPVQDPEVWIPLHREYWNGLLKAYGKACTDDMRIIVEPFELVYAA